MIPDKAVEAAWLAFDAHGDNPGKMRAALEAAAPFLLPSEVIEAPEFTVGTSVIKTGGYPYPGEVRAVFANKAGHLRYVVEATGEDYRGMLHIFNAAQLAAATPEGDADA